jgi:putative redox protein
MLNVHWRGAESFETITETGRSIVMEAPPGGPSPVEAFLGAAAACSAIDVIGILHKMRQQVDAYRIEVEWERGPQDVYPRPIVSMTVRHIVSGKDVELAAVEKAVTLSDEKYCGVMATLRTPPLIKTEFSLESDCDLTQQP